MTRDMLFGGLEHIALRTIFAGKSIDIEQAAAAYVDRMLHGIIPRKEPRVMPDELVRLSTLIDRMEETLPGAKRR